MRVKIKHLVLSLTMSLSMVLISCANEIPPIGGPEDKTGPIIDTIYPAAGTLNFKGDQIVIKFNEYIQPQSYASEIFISPVLNHPPSIITKGKRIYIRFKGDLEKNTTYVIQVGKGIKDYPSGNEMETAHTFAFSTGGHIDSLSFTGFVYDSWSQRGLNNIKLLLFPEEGFNPDSIMKKKPMYAALSNETGAFQFSYLKAGQYYLYGVDDADNSYSISNSAEKVAVNEQEKIVVDTGNSQSLKLYMFSQDIDPPRVRSALWVNSKIVAIDFKEKISTEYNGDSIRVFISDTSGNNLVLLRNICLAIDEPRFLMVYPGVSDSSWFDLKLIRVTDSLGNTCDTILRFGPESQSKKPWKGKFNPPQFSYTEDALILNSYVPVKQFFEDSLVSLTDSAGNLVKTHFISDNLVLKIFINQADGPPPYYLKIKAGLPFRDGTYLDSTVTFKIKEPRFNLLGSVSGVLNDSAYPGNWLISIWSDKGKLYGQTQSKNYKFRYLTAGKYFFQYLKDDDGNRVWTPGSIVPKRLPEFIYKEFKPVEIREKWDIEDYGLEIKNPNSVGIKSKPPLPEKK